MPAPNGYDSDWASYTTELGGAPQHTGSRYMYGPFVVTSRTDIKSADFLPEGGVVILGENWSSAGITLPNNFYWGVLVKTTEGSGDAQYVLNYATKLGNTVTHNNFSKTPALTPTDGGDYTNVTWGTFNTTNAITATIDNRYKNKFSMALPADSHGPTAAALPTGAAAFLVANYGGRLDAYAFTHSDDVWSVKRIYTERAASNATYQRVRSSEGSTTLTDDKLVEELVGGGYVYTGDANFSTGDASSSVYGGAANLHTLSGKQLHLEKTMYGDDGKVYRSYSDPVHLNILHGGGEIVLNLRYWQGPTPVDEERYPYEDVKVRLVTGPGDVVQADRAFWVSN